jgi:RNA polymerase sigma factor (sigma-70 family)
MDSWPERLEEDLIRSSEWLRSLARSLVRDSSTADDLAQDAWTSLAEHGTGRARSLRGFLAGIVRNLAKEKRRETERRTRRERSVARAESLPSSAELVERLEMQRTLVEVLRELSEPQRTAILLRYAEGLSAAEIARRQGIAAGAVRARLKRGLDEMRAKLDARFRGRRDEWHFALVPWISSKSVPIGIGSGVATGIAGALIMKWILSGAVVIAALLALWWSGWIGARRDNLSLATREASASTALSVPESGEGARASLDERTDARARSILPAATTLAAPDVAADHTVIARIVDEDGMPIANATLTVPEQEARASATSSPDGRVRLTFPRDVLDAMPHRSDERIVWIEARAKDHAVVRLVQDRGIETTTWLGDIVLTTGGTISGRVVDAHGKAVARARVTAGRGEPGGKRSVQSEPYADIAEMWDVRRVLRDAVSVHDPRIWPVQHARADRDGFFRLECVPLGWCSVWACEGSRPWTRSESIALRGSDRAKTVLIELEDPDTSHVISGTLSDPDGRPIAHERVDMWDDRHEQSASRTTTLDDGSFSCFVEDGQPKHIDVRPSDPTWQAIFTELITPGTVGLYLRFEHGRVCTLRATDEAGNGVQSGYAYLQPSLRNWAVEEARQLHFASDGTLRVAAPVQRITIRIGAPTYLDEETGPFTAQDMPESIAVVLKRASCLAGHVTVDDKAVSGARVAWNWTDRPASWRKVDQRCGGEGEPLIWKFGVGASWPVTTDASGRFRMGVPPISNAVHEYYLYAEADGLASSTIGPIEFDVQKGADGFEIALSHGGSLEGRLVLPHQRDTAAWTIRAHNGLGDLREQSLGEEGRYRFDHLRAGGWQVRAAAPGPKLPVMAWVKADHEPRIDVEITEGVTAHYDVVIDPPIRPRLLGRLTFAGRELAASVIVDDQTMYTLEPEAIPLDCDGAFRARLVLGVPNRICAGVSGPHAGFNVTDIIPPPSGVVRWDHDIPLGEIDGTYKPESSTDVDPKRIAWEWNSGAELRASGEWKIDEQGRVESALVPCGHITVFRWAREAGRIWFGQGRRIAELVVTKDTKLSVDLR